MRSLFLILIVARAGALFSAEPAPEIATSGDRSAEFSSAVVDMPTCSGVIIVRGAEKAYGVSAAHCCGDLHSQFDITTASGTKSKARWLAVDRSVDLALFVAWSKNTDGVAHVLSPLPESPEWSAIGYPAGHRGQAVKSLSFRTRTVIEEQGSSRQFERNRFNLKRGHFGGGDSGGGVFAHHERSGVSGLVGIMTHGGISATTNQQLVAFVQASYPKMDRDCRDCIENWNTAPSPPESRDTRPGQHNLPEFIDTDRERGELILRLMARIEALETRLATVSNGQDGQTGPAGRDGKDGEPGRDGTDGRNGTDGRDGADAVIDYDQLAAEVKKRLPPIPTHFSIQPRKLKKGK